MALIARRLEAPPSLVNWGDNRIRGRSTYRLTDDGALLIEDSLLIGGRRTAFATATLRRPEAG